MHSLSEENYLKAIYKLLEKGDKKISTTAIAALVETAPASVTDMLKKLAEKKLIRYEKYQGVALSTSGRKVAVNIIRKHRLWELFLVEKLGFSWDEVHEIAEQLEHIKSEALITKLDHYLGYPKYDPHGDPIPDDQGIFHVQNTIPLSAAEIDKPVIITGVIDHRPVFLRFMEKEGYSLGKKIIIRQKLEIDQSMSLLLSGNKKIKHISHEVARNILVLPVK
ncbi:MAG: metal-dependent transcriptional regulator [Bacteroidetes bacterium]|nr:metal-dependent transcriptional regulator [Bacteroidota bacterium]MBL0064129.1 metal-dependent transcriptional regulator [Bacteroidota bacterium]